MEAASPRKSGLDGAAVFTPVHRMVAYGLQAAAILLWWVALLISPKIYALFSFESVSRETFLCFTLPDLVALVGFSVAAMVSDSRIWRAAALGGFVYSTTFCLALAVHTQSGALGVITMGIAVCYNVVLTFEGRMIHRGRGAGAAAVLGRTLLQCLVLWTVTLAVIPTFLEHIFGREGWARPIGGWQIAALAGFLFCATLSLWSGWVMAVRGRGTPAPFDAAVHLVVTGPYAHVRNPMAIAGLGLGFCVAVYLESTVVAVYVAAGVIFWNSFIRPIEEADLAATFGPQFHNYRAQVACWVPRIARYQPSEAQGAPLFAAEGTPPGRAPGEEIGSKEYS